MGITQSAYVSQRTPTLTKPVNIISNHPEIVVGTLLSDLGIAITDYDIRNRLTDLNECNCVNKPVKFTDENLSNATALHKYSAIRNVEPLVMERDGCLKNTTDDFVDNALFPLVKPEVKPCCDQKLIAACVMCYALPCLCPCIVAGLCLGGGQTSNIEINSFERARSLIAAFESLDEKLEKTPLTRTYFCCTTHSPIDRNVVRMVVGFRILSEVDKIFANNISEICDHADVLRELERMMTSKDVDEMRNMVKENNEKFEEKFNKAIAEDREVMLLNKKFNDFLLSSRIAKDFVTNDLLNKLFHNREKTPVGDSTNFLLPIERNLHSIQALIDSNYQNLRPVATKAYPTLLEPVLAKIREAIKISQISMRVKTASGIMAKEDKELQKGIQDLFAMRLFTDTDDIFATFSLMSLQCEVIKRMSTVRNVIVSHKLKTITSWLDFKVLIQFNTAGYPFVELQLVPTRNFIIDEAVGGHDVHKDAGKGAPGGGGGGGKSMPREEVKEEESFY